MVQGAWGQVLEVLRTDASTEGHPGGSGACESRLEDLAGAKSQALWEEDREVAQWLLLLEDLSHTLAWSTAQAAQALACWP